MKHRIAQLLTIGALAALLSLPAWADTSVAKRLDARGVTYTVDEDGDYKVIYNYADEGRTQLAFVSTSPVFLFDVLDIHAFDLRRVGLIRERLHGQTH